MEEEYPRLESSFADFSRASAAIGIGTVSKGYESIQRILRNMELDEKQKFLEAAQLFCYKEQFVYEPTTMERIAERFPRIRFLNPPTCVLALKYFIRQDNSIILENFKKDDDTLSQKMTEYEIERLDLYRCAVVISNILKGV